MAAFNFSVALNDTVYGAYKAGVWAAGTWYFIAATYDGSATKIYVDAVLKHDLPASGTMANYGKNVHIGKYTNTNNNDDQLYLPGTIDEVRIYNRSLTPAEIQYLYQNP